MTVRRLLRGHGRRTVQRAAGGDPAGDLPGDLAGFVRLGFEPGDHEPKPGVMPLPRARGFGCAAEAAARAQRHAFETLATPTLVSSVDPDDAASIRAARRLGGVRDSAAERAHNGEVLIFRYAPP